MQNGYVGTVARDIPGEAMTVSRDRTFNTKEECYAFFRRSISSELAASYDLTGWPCEFTPTDAQPRDTRE